MVKPKVLIAQRVKGYNADWIAVYSSKRKMRDGLDLIMLCVSLFQKHSGISLRRNQSCKFKLVKVK